MIMKKVFSYLFIITLLLIISPAFSFAQTTLNGGFLEMSLSPEKPTPLENVTITLQSFSYDLDRSKITWLVNGVEKRTEIGLKTFTVLAGQSGQKTTVGVRVETPEDGIQKSEVSFTPAVVDLIYEALSYTPPFYKGRALNPNQGKVLVTAIPELINSAGSKISSKNILYSWKKDGTVQQSASGIGKNIFIFSGSVPVRDILIEVTASSLEGNISASQQINITNSSPKIVFYENSLIYGIMFNQAIKNTVNLITDEFSAVAVPYFFTTNSTTGSELDYVWKMNGQTVENQEPKNSFTTRVDTPGSGLADISLKISNNVRIFQFTNNNYSINFSKQ